MAASRIGSRIMIAARSLSSKVVHAAISSTERPQPVHRPESGCSVQTRLHGVSMSTSIVLIGPDPESRHHKRAEQKPSMRGEIY